MRAGPRPPGQPVRRAPAESLFELRNLTVDPEERTNRADTDGDTKAQLLTLLEGQRDAKRLLPALRNP